jgi:WD40 repeat protein
MLKIKKLSHFTGHTGALYALAKENNKTFFSAGSDRIVVQWNIDEPESGIIVAKSTDTVYSLLRYSTNFIIGLSSGSILVLDFESKREIRNLQFHKSGVFDLCYSSKKNILISCGGDGNVCFADAENFSVLKTFHFGNFKIRSCAINADETHVAIGCGDGSVAIIDLHSLKIENRFASHQQNFSVNAIAFSSDGNYLLSGSRDAHLHVYDVKNNFSSLEKIPNYAIYKIQFSPDGKLFATASRDKTIKIWDTQNFKILARLDKEKFDGHVNSVNTLLWLNDSVLLTAGDDRAVIAWDIKQ